MEDQHMSNITFRVDKNLCITSWGEKIVAFTGNDAELAIGKKYYEVFPRLYDSDADVVSLIFEKNRKINLKNYQISSDSKNVSVDITIEPMHESAEAHITLSNFLHKTPVQSSMTSQFVEIGKMASALVHGVRNPLNTIKGAVTYLSNKYEHDPVFVEFTDIIHAEIMKLDDFITKFLRSSLTNRENAETDINELLRNVHTLVSVQTRTKHIQVDFAYGDLPPIITNYFLIEQAVLNIINNAVEAMPSGGRLSVRSRVETFSDEKHVLIEISDSGSGIDTKKISDLSAYLGNDGKGFGLFLTREILNYYGGHLVIRSRNENGTTVKLYIPVQKDV